MTDTDFRLPLEMSVCQYRSCSEFRCRSSSIGSTASTQNDSEGESPAPLSPDVARVNGHSPCLPHSRHMPVVRSEPMSKLFAVLNGTLTTQSYQRSLPKIQSKYLPDFLNQNYTTDEFYEDVGRKRKSEVPMDLTCKKLRPSSGSILESILSQGRSVFRGTSLNDNPSNNAVQLAKKTVAPVTRRISYWCKNIVTFALSLNEFKNLPVEYQLKLLKESWSRLLLLTMAEANFEFVTTSKITQPSDTVDDRFCNLATRHDASKVVSFVDKCRRLNIDSDEFDLLRELSLFNISHANADVAFVRAANARTRRRLQVKCCSQPDRYASLLMVLPDLTGIRAVRIESLFCGEVVKSNYAKDFSQLITQWFIDQINL